MVCNCNNTVNDNTIQFIAGTSVFLTFNFNEDISSYTGAVFTIRADYNTEPVINKSVTIENPNEVNIVLTPDKTSDFSDFQNGKNSATYIWGLDLIDSVNNIQINVFPQTGQAAPLCIVYKHVVEG